MIMSKRRFRLATRSDYDTTRAQAGEPISATVVAFLRSSAPPRPRRPLRAWRPPPRRLRPRGTCGRGGGREPGGRPRASPRNQPWVIEWGSLSSQTVWLKVQFGRMRPRRPFCARVSASTSASTSTPTCTTTHTAARASICADFYVYVSGNLYICACTYVYIYVDNNAYVYMHADAYWLLGLAL